MPELSLTQMVDVVSKSGTPKATCVRNIKAQLADPYDPATDFYKLFRESVVEAHAGALGKSRVSAAASRVFDPRRAAQYASLATDYNGWWGRKTIAWFAPPRSSWTPPGSAFGVNVNPELGLEINGVRHVVKLYFKSDKLTKARIDIVAELMHDEFAAAYPQTEFSVLDVRNRKLHTVVPPTGLGPVLVAELAYVAALWPHV